MERLFKKALLCLVWPHDRHQVKDILSVAQWNRRGGREREREKRWCLQQRCRSLVCNYGFLKTKIKLASSWNMRGLTKKSFPHKWSSTEDFYTREESVDGSPQLCILYPSFTINTQTLYGYKHLYTVGDMRTKGLSQSWPQRGRQLQKEWDAGGTKSGGRGREESGTEARGRGNVDTNRR